MSSPPRLLSEAETAGLGGKREQPTNLTKEKCSLPISKSDRLAAPTSTTASIAPVTRAQQRGWKGKCNVDDIIAIRALAFDIDIIKRPFDNRLLLEFIDRELTGPLRPSLLINTGGGYHLIYLLDKPISVSLFRPAIDDDQEQANEQAKADRFAITRLAYEFESLLRSIIPSELKDCVKIDNMSNVDRVMRLPGTVNYPKAEKRAKGQIEAPAYIEVNYHCRCDIFALRKNVARGPEAPPVRAKPTVIKTNKNWPNIRKVRIACTFIKNKIPEVDDNSWYTYNVMFPLQTAIHDPVDPISEADAFECFMEAVSGGARYGIMGRGPRILSAPVEIPSSGVTATRNLIPRIGYFIWPM